MQEHGLSTLVAPWGNAQVALPTPGKRDRLNGWPHPIQVPGLGQVLSKKVLAPIGEPIRASTSKTLKLLDFHRCAGGLEGCLGLVGVGLGDLLEHGLGGTVHEVLGFLQSQAGQCTHFLDHLNLLVASA